jgi:hypothetical protein
MMVQGSGALPSAHADRIPTSLTLVEDFDPLLSRLDSVLVQLNTVTDRVVGPRPTVLDKQAEAAHPSPPPPGHLMAALGRRREFLARLVDGLESEAARLGLGIG